MKSIVLFAAATLLSASAMASVPVLSNGGFETTTVGANDFSYGFSMAGVAADWTFYSNAGVSGADSAFGGVASSGNYFALLQSHEHDAAGSMSQSFTSTGTGTYSIDFDLSARPSHDSGEQVIVSLDGTTIGTYTSTNTWTALSASTTIGAGSHVLTFTGLNAAGVDSTAYLDNIRISAAAAVSAVPEASTYAMLLAGLGLIGFVARRRNAA